MDKDKEFSNEINDTIANMTELTKDIITLTTTLIEENSKKSKRERINSLIIILALLLSFTIFGCCTVDNYFDGAYIKNSTQELTHSVENGEVKVEQKWSEGK